MTAIEKEICTYYLNYLHHQLNTTVEVHEIDMGGWVLYECFILPEYGLIHISNENNLLQCLGIEKPEHQDHAAKIMGMIGSLLLQKIGLN